MDDTYLVIVRSLRDTISKELKAKKEWAMSNNPRLNTNKTKEMLVTRQFVTSPLLLPPNIALYVNKMTILGIIFRSDLLASVHIKRLL